jgi:predicted transcriptional regulator
MVETGMIVRPDEPLLNKFVGPLESDILRAVWAGRQTAAEITTWLHEYVNPAVRPNLIAVKVRQMVDKGLLLRTGEAPYRYRAHIGDEAQFIGHMIARTLDGLIDDYPDEVWRIIACKVTPLLKKKAA